MFCHISSRTQFDYIRKKLFLLTILWLTACTSSNISCDLVSKSDFVFVVGEDWHAQIGIPIENLQGSLAFLPALFPAAQVIMIGYGKKTFFTAKPQNLSEYILGPFPGAGVIQVVGLNTTPLEAYPSGSALVVNLPLNGLEHLEKFIGDDFVTDSQGNPQLVAPSHNPEGLFFSAKSEYSLLHTCNAWTAQALQAGGLDISSDGVIFSQQVWDQVGRIITQECKS